MSDAFDKQLAFGAEGEHLIARLLMRRGAVVVPLYQFEGHDRAPIALYEVEGAQLSRVIPDLICWRGRQYFAEVKRKQRWVNYRPAHRGLETGFNLRHWSHYRELRERTHSDVFVFFIQEQMEPTGVFVAELGQLEPHLRVWDGFIKGGGRLETEIALFPHEALTCIGDLELVYGERSR